MKRLHWWVALSASVLTSFLCASSMLAQSQRCVQESIHVFVNSAYCLLSGSYTFRNFGPSTSAQSIFYPIINTNEQPFPDSIKVRNSRTQQDVAFGRSDEGISFLVNTRPNDTCTYVVSFRQSAPVSKMEHILGMSRNKGNRLERVSITIIVPDALRLKDISFRFDKIEKRPQERVYSIVRTNFLPEKNLVISWEKKK